MFKKITLISLGIIISFGFLFGAEDAFANEEVNVYFFWGEGCPHCAKEKPFLEKMEEKYPEVEVHDFEVWKNSENRSLLTEVGKKLDANVSGVPFTVVGEKYFTGWLSEATTGKDIENAIQCALEKSCEDPVGEVLSPNQEEKEEEPCGCEEDSSALPSEIELAFLGKIDPSDFSLPMITIILGGIDGFNPCAMWTLLFLISLLLGMKDKKKRWILGTAFIVASAFVYFLFMAAWLNLILFLGVINWVRILIGLIALGGGAYNLKEFFVNKEGVCKVTGGEKKQAVFEKMKEFTQKKNLYLALGGIILLAFAVNLVEAICSAGLPVVFTQILTLSDLSTTQYYAYMLLYILVFMLDDLFIFFVAMKSMELTEINTKYSRASHLIGGALMIIIGILIIFKPGLLMFG